MVFYKNYSERSLLLLRYRLRELMADYQYKTGERITFGELSQKTGIHRATLSRIANQKGYSTVTDNIDKLCDFFGCTVSDLMEHIPSEIE